MSIFKFLLRIDDHKFLLAPFIKRNNNKLIFFENLIHIILILFEYIQKRPFTYGEIVITPFLLMPLPPLLFIGLTSPYPIYRLLYSKFHPKSTFLAIINISNMFLHLVNIEYYGGNTNDRTIACISLNFL